MTEEIWRFEVENENENENENEKHHDVNFLQIFLNDFIGGGNSSTNFSIVSYT